MAQMRIDAYEVLYSANGFAPRIALKNADFQNAIDLLRNEKPIYIYVYHRAIAASAAICCDHAPATGGHS